MQSVRSQQDHKNPRDASPLNVVSEIIETQEMHQVAMQSLNSQLKKNLGDDIESGASQLVVIFYIFSQV